MMKKMTIAVPEEIVRAIDRVARERNTTRSGLISDLLRRATRARSDAELRRIVDDLFADPRVAREQLDTAEAFGGAGRSDGTEWPWPPRRPPRRPQRRRRERPGRA